MDERTTNDSFMQLPLRMAECFAWGAGIGFCYGLLAFHFILGRESVLLDSHAAALRTLAYIGGVYAILGGFLGILSGLFIRLGEGVLGRKTDFFQRTAFIFSGITIFSIFINEYLRNPYAGSSIMKIEYLIFISSWIIVGSLGLVFVFLFRSSSWLKRLLSFLPVPVALSASIFIHWGIMRAGSEEDYAGEQLKQTQVYRQKAQEDINFGRLIMTAVDGASWNVLIPMVRTGRAPNFEAFFRHGHYGSLISLRPMYSPLIWSSLITGKTPEQHGIVDFLIYQIRGTRKFLSGFPCMMNLVKESGIFPVVPISSRLRKVKALWNIFSDHDVSCVVMNWWAGWPAEPAKGLNISDRFGWSRFSLFSPERVGQATYPENMPASLEKFIISPFDSNAALTSKFGYSFDMSAQVKSYMDPFFMLRLAAATTETSHALSAYLMKKYQPQFAALYFPGIDYVSHFFWKEFEPRAFSDRDSSLDSLLAEVIPEFYRMHDRLLETLFSTGTKKTSWLLVSDHGFGAAVPHEDNYYLYKKFKKHSGTHRLKGVLAWAEAGLTDRSKLPDSSIYEIAPLLLNYFGLPAARDMAGARMKNLDSLKTGPHFNMIETYETGEKRGQEAVVRSPLDEDIKKRLQGLGYIR